MREAGSLFGGGISCDQLRCQMLRAQDRGVMGRYQTQASFSVRLSFLFPPEKLSWHPVQTWVGREEGEGWTHWLNKHEPVCAPAYVYMCVFLDD